MAQQKVPPFDRTSQLVDDSDTDLLAVETPVPEYLAAELCTPVLDELGGRLTAIATKSGSHIDPLHKQLLKQRNIIIAEDPRLHMIWYYTTVYLKPIPPCLLNYNFWQTHLLPPGTFNTNSSVNLDKYDIATLSTNSRAALGFLRSYSYLIRHRSDLIIAQNAHLIPSHIKFSDFQSFIRPFRDLPDHVVTLRYQYGQIRLTRLNWAIRIFQPKSTGNRFSLHYQALYWQTGQYLERLIGPALFVFAAFSLILSSMQLVIAALGKDTWEAFSSASWGFSLAVIILIPAIATCVMIGVATALLLNVVFALQTIRKDRLVSKQTAAAGSP